MKKSVIVLAALAVAACGQQPYQQTAQRACDPQTQDCYGYGAGRDSHGDALVAGAVAGAAGYALGRATSNNNRYDHDYDRDRDYRRDRDYDRGYHDTRRPTTVVKNYYNTPAPSTYRSSPPVSVTRTAPSVSRPATRTMFGSARRK